MTSQSTVSRVSKKADGKREKPPKPYQDFPLFPHGNGFWCKKINGRLRYFGRWDDWQGALKKYQRDRDDLHADRVPRSSQNSITVRELCNLFLKTKRMKMDSGRLSPRTFVDYHRTSKRLTDLWGDRSVTSLTPDDFETLYAKLMKYKPATLASEIVMTRSVFKYGYKNGKIAKEVTFGELFAVPSTQEKRAERTKAKARHGKKMFEAAEIRALLDIASPQVKAMILLAANAGFGNTDCASLTLTALDLDNGWVDFPRPKTGAERRCPLWPETTTALRVVIEKRKNPPDPADEGIVFLTKYNQRWVRFDVVEEKKHGKLKVRAKQDDAIAKEFAKLLRELKIKRPRIGFYALRHGFETIAGNTADQVATNFLMGHVDSSMSAEYREHISDDRLRAVTDYVRAWLWPRPTVG